MKENPLFQTTVTALFALETLCEAMEIDTEESTLKIRDQETDEILGEILISDVIRGIKADLKEHAA